MMSLVAFSMPNLIRSINYLKVRRFNFLAFHIKNEHVRNRTHLWTILDIPFSNNKKGASFRKPLMTHILDIYEVGFIRMFYS